jgi:TolB-like protein
MVNTLKEPLHKIVPTVRSLKTKTALIVSVVLILGILISAFVIYSTRKEEEPVKHSIKSIVVLPFKNATQNPENEYLSDGLTESLINILSGLPNLKVIARSTVFTYKGKNIDPIKIGNQLKVRSVLTGELVQRGNTIIVQADLLDAHDGSQLWGKQYNRKLSDIILMQDEISRAIAEHLRFRLSGEEKRILTRDYTKDAQAFQLYLKGRYYWNKYTLDGFKKSIQYYQQAIDKDPTYALAYAGMAQTYAVLSGDGMALAKDVMPKAKAAAMKALEIDETLAEAHNSLGIYKMYYEWDWPGAERAYTCRTGKS